MKLISVKELHAGHGCVLIVLFRNYCLDLTDTNLEYSLNDSWLLCVYNFFKK